MKVSISDMECSDDNWLECLQSKDFTDILQPTKNYLETFWMPVPDFSYKADPFFPDDPLNLLKTVTPDIEVMIGTTKDEGIIYLSGLTLSYFEMKK